MNKSTFTTVREFVDYVGRKRLADQGAYAQVVHNWIRDGRIPANWLSVFARLHDGDLPMELFHMRAAR